VRLAWVAAILVLGLSFVSCGGDSEPVTPVAPIADGSGWSAYGGDAGGSGFSELSQITPENVAALEEAWTFQTGDGTNLGYFKFETTPIVNGFLYLSTPLNAVIALNPSTGEEVWRFDPEIDLNKQHAQGMVSRGVSFWEDSLADGKCSRRIFIGTVDSRLIALDATDGVLCEEFGGGGEVRLDTGVGPLVEANYTMTSPPSIANDVVVIGSSIRDNVRVEEAYGTVRGYNARTGEMVWAWDPIPRRPEDPGWDTWTPEAASIHGAANAWAPISADPVRDLVFVPTSSAAPDHYGGERPGANLFTSSVVALRASTGEFVWHFQIVHHDIFDYDVPAQPSLIAIPRDGQEVDAVAVVTKMGHIFVLDRETGDPLFPVEERPVPASDVEGEEAWPTQPFPVLPPPLLEAKIGPEDAWGPTSGAAATCRAKLTGLRNEGIFTPPSLKGTLVYPWWGGGTNWGGAAYDKDKSILVTGVRRLPAVMRLEPRESAAAGNMLGTPYEKDGSVIYGPSGLPCIAPPWGELVGVDLATGEIKWRTPIGEVPEGEVFPSQEIKGVEFWGGPIATAGGVVFQAGSVDGNIRAYDTESGEELWKAPLPAGGQATPMTYEAAGRQYVVIAAGGHGDGRTDPGDYFVAFALPE